MEDPSLNQDEQSHTHSELEGKRYNGSSHDGKQNYHDQRQQQQPPFTTENRLHDQLPPPPSEPQRQCSSAQTPAQEQQPIQYHFQANQTQPAGPSQFPQHNPQPNFKFQNVPNQPGRTFPPQSPQPQYNQVSQAQYQHQMPPYPYQQQMHQYQQQPNPIYQNGAHQPQAYPQHPPPSQNNMGPGPPTVTSQQPQPASQTAPSPLNFHQVNGGGAAGFGGGIQENYPNGAVAQQNGAGKGFPMHNQFQTPQPSYGQQGGWSTGLFDCMDDPMNAAVTAIFPCITFGQVAEIIDNGATSCSTSGVMYGLVAFFIGIPCIMSCTYRTKLRNKFGLLETPAPDWVTHFLCDCCAICQEYRELQIRGFDPSIGWQGNLAKMQGNQQPQHMMPPMNQQMMS
ncbi:hypothetical protein CsatA_001352 [Cannabis sativa]